MFGDFMSILQDVIPEAISSQKYHMNMGLILYVYGDRGILKCGMHKQAWTCS